MRLVPEKCRCGFCEHCAKQLSRERRNWLKHVTSEYVSPQLMTLTVDRDGTITGIGFPGPAQAFRFIQEKRYVARLMQALGVKKYVWVLEFQMESGEGWPHWHIVFDGWVDLKRAWSMWRDRWRVGGLDLEPAKDRQRIAGYLCGYLAKGGDVPDWVRKEPCGSVRVISSSRSTLSFTIFRLGRVVKRWVDLKRLRYVAGVLMERKKRSSRRTIGAQIRECRKRLNVFRVVDREGEPGWLKHIGKLLIGVRTARKLASMAGVRFETLAEWKVESWLRSEVRFVNDDGEADFKEGDLIRDSQGRCIAEFATICGIRAVQMIEADYRYCFVDRFGLAA